jgi:hypothetical protein
VGGGGFQFALPLADEDSLSFHIHEEHGSTMRS